MAGLRAKKAELLKFIQWKTKYSEEEMKSLKKLSYANLRRWAVINDIIDE